MGDGDVHPALSKQFQLAASVSTTMVESDQHPPQTEHVKKRPSVSPVHLSVGTSTTLSELLVGHAPRFLCL